jgi:class 3 adenylate cyclase
MSDDKEKDLIYKIAKLIKENKELTSQVKELTVQNDKLVNDNDRLENILAKLPPDVLPKGIKANIGSTTLRFKMATVMFMDIQGFKKISEGSHTGDVIDELDQIFFHFNDIAERFNLQRIKTIGDAYMCAGGVPIKNNTNPIDVVLAALEMGAYLNQLKEEYETQNREFWDLRIGIHTGPVTATASGKKKISYDLKGETVNIASRMASAADISKINISINTYVLVSEYFVCDYHGSIPVKYEGEMEMYHVKRLKPPYSLNRKTGINPNEIFQVKYALRQFSDLQEIILDKLERELPAYLYYHNYKHTIDVVNQAELIGYGEGVDDEAILLLKTAGLFHDAGHTISYKNHEYYGCQIAKEMLPKFKYTDAQIEKICEIIMATMLPPKPTNLLERIICDSDLDYLGRSDFIPVSNTLYEELKAQNFLNDLNEWNKMQVKFLTGHHYFTETANRLRDVNKEKQIERIKSIIVWTDQVKRLEFDKIIEAIQIQENTILNANKKPEEKKEGEE